MREAALLDLEMAPDTRTFDDDDGVPYMTDGEFDDGLAEAARGEGELFEPASLEDFRGDA